MPNYMIAYFGGDQPQTRQEGMAQMKKWKAWITGLGDSVINPGTPLQESWIVTSDSIKEDTNLGAMNGFAVIQAKNIEAAVKIAQSDPFLENNGTIRVSRMEEMQ